MIEEATNQIISAVKETIANDYSLEKLKKLIEEKLQKAYDSGYNDAELQGAIDEAEAEGDY